MKTEVVSVFRIYDLTTEKLSRFEYVWLEKLSRFKGMNQRVKQKKARILVIQHTWPYNWKMNQH